MSTCSATCISWWEHITFEVSFFITKWAPVQLYHGENTLHFEVSFFITRWAPVQLYHGENTLHFEVSFFNTKWTPVQLYHGENTLHFEVSFFNTKWAPVQLYHGENTLQFNEMKTMIYIVHFTIIRNLNILDSFLNTTYMICVLKNVMNHDLFILIK